MYKPEKDEIQPEKGSQHSVKSFGQTVAVFRATQLKKCRENSETGTFEVKSLYCTSDWLVEFTHLLVESKDVLQSSSRIKVMKDTIISQS